VQAAYFFVLAEICGESAPRAPVSAPFWAQPAVEPASSARLLRGVTQEKLAEALNISYQAVSKWENNAALPDLSLVVPLANFFGAPIDELFGFSSRGTFFGRGKCGRRK
jgi:DNA-binding XRE family transcriptional regulator